jgi:hypothetical protein
MRQDEDDNRGNRDDVIADLENGSRDPAEVDPDEFDLDTDTWDAGADHESLMCGRSATPFDLSSK